ncbi:hypothetical protein BH18CHL2_BH18CHL2_04250 [soil metagenome]
MRAPSAHPPPLLKTHRVASARLGVRRLVRVLMPKEPRAILVLNDGQNVFTRPVTVGATHRWRADEVAAVVAPRLAIVGIDHARGARAVDYLPYPNPRDPRALRPQGDRYTAFVVDELLGWLVRTYPRAAQATHLGIGGASYGAVSAMRTVMTRPGVFDRLLLESPSLWIAERRLLGDARAATVWPERVHLAIGTHESPWAEINRRAIADAVTLAETLREAGLGPDRLRVRVEEGARHSEIAWAARLPDALRFLFG